MTAGPTAQETKRGKAIYQVANVVDQGAPAGASGFAWGHDG